MNAICKFNFFFLNLTEDKETTGFPGSSVVKNPPANAEASSIPESGRPLEKEMTTHSSILAWEIPWTEEPGSSQSIKSQRVGHDLVTKQQGN